jgi:hypothetical protein
MLENDHYIKDDGTIQTVETDDTFDRFFVEDKFSQTGYQQIAQLEKNDAGLVLFPENGTGISSYPPIDAGGTSTDPNEIVGQGDHYLKPETAAALFGLANILSKHGLTVSFGDMSSSNGSDPWQAGAAHHGGHGHLAKRSGLDVDFRYLNTSGVSFQSEDAFNSNDYSSKNNQRIFDIANTYGFTKNYQGNNGSLTGATKAANHNNHSHLGLEYKSLNWQFVPAAPIRQSF